MDKPKCFHLNGLGVCKNLESDNYKNPCTEMATCDKRKTDTPCAHYDLLSKECFCCINDDAEMFHDCFYKYSESQTPENTSDIDSTLNLYFILFSVHKGKEWFASAGYIFAKNKDSALDDLNKTYGEVRLRSIEEVPVEEGTILYGERWHKL